MSSKFSAAGSPGTSPAKRHFGSFAPRPGRPLTRAGFGRSLGDPEGGRLAASLLPSLPAPHLCWPAPPAGRELWQSSSGGPRPRVAAYVAGTGVHGRGGRRRSCMLPAISRRSATSQLVVVDRSGAKLVPNVAGPPRTIRTSRHGEGSSVCSVECSWSC